MHAATKAVSGGRSLLQRSVKIWHVLLAVLPLLAVVSHIRSRDHSRCNTLRAAHVAEVSAVMSETRLPRGSDASGLGQYFTPRLQFDATADPVRAIRKRLKSSRNPCRAYPRRNLTFGQNEEDRFAWEHFFHKQKGGVFLELGGYDGCTYSNTIMFEYYLGWRGVLIEPGPRNYAKLVVNRPKSAAVNAAICSASRAVHFVEADAVGGVVEFMSRKFIKKWHKNLNVKKLPSISCLPLRDVLKHLSVRHINFWSLDVEGGELEVLKTFDFDQVQVDVIVMEAFQDDRARNNATKSMLQSHGFSLYRRGARNNWWWVHEGFVPFSVNTTSEALKIGS